MSTSAADRSSRRSINTFPYRVEPQLHLYAGLLVLHLSSISLPSGSRTSTHTNASPSTPAERAAFIHASLFEPAHEHVLRAATHHFDGAVAAAANKRVVSQRLRQYDQKLEEKRTLKRSQTAQREPSVGEKRGREALSDAETDVEGEQRDDEAGAVRRGSDEDEDQDDDEERDPEDDLEEEDEGAPSSDWAEDLAKAYLALVSYVAGRRSYSGLTGVDEAASSSARRSSEQLTLIPNGADSRSSKVRLSLGFRIRLRIRLEGGVGRGGGK